MAILLGVQICTTRAGAKAGAIIGRMENLLDKRRCFQVTRQQFLCRWGKLRRALFLTKDYQDLRARIKARAGGKCEVCHDELGQHLHHLEPVAFAPRLVLLDINCIWACVACHPEEDKKAQMRARRIKHQHRSDHPLYAGGSRNAPKGSISSNRPSPDRMHSEDRGAASIASRIEGQYPDDRTVNG